MDVLSILNVELIGLIVAVLGLILAVLALVVGFVHVRGIHRVMREAKAQADQAKTHTNALDEIRRSLSTRLIGTFPDYYDDIANLLGDAQRSIVVFCDLPAYGSFTKRATWVTYHQNLVRKLFPGRLRIEITCLHKDWRRKSVEQQFFGTGKAWGTLKQEATFVKPLQELLAEHPEAPKLADLSQKEFEDILESEELNALEDLKKANIHEIEAHMPLYFWLIDSGTARARAIFAIPSFSEKIVEYGFSTTDQGLISAFEQMRDLYHKDFSAGSAVSGEPAPE